MVQTVRYDNDNNGDEDYDLMKVASTTNSRVMRNSESGALPLWLQQQLDRSIAKHLEKGFYLLLLIMYTIQFTTYSLHDLLIDLFTCLVAFVL